MGWGQSGMGQGQGAPPWADPGQQQRTLSGLGAVAEHLTGAAHRRGQKVGPLWRVVRMRTGGLRAQREGAAGVLAVLRAPPDLPLHARDISVSMRPTFQRVLPRGSALGEIPSGVMEPVGNYPCSKHVHPSLEPGSPVRGSWGQRVSLMARSDTSCQHTTQELAGSPCAWPGHVRGGGGGSSTLLLRGEPAAGWSSLGEEALQHVAASSLPVGAAGTAEGTCRRPGASGG